MKAWRPGARYAAEHLKAFSERILQWAGARSADAVLTADGLVTADLRGVHSHGVVRIDVYAARLRSGGINPAAELVVVRDRGPVVVADAQAGLGIAMAVRAMDLAIERAGAYGFSAVGVRNSSHCGMLAYVALRAVQRRMVGIALSNADAQVAPWGARQRYLGTNPLAVAVPAGEEPPIVLDMATSVVAHGRIRAAAARGEPIPPEWALDEYGRPTTDPHQALRGALLPFGGPKGSGISLIIDILAGILPGGRSGPEIVPLYTQVDHPQGVGHLLMAIAVDAFGDAEAFQRRVDRLIRDVRALPAAQGQGEVLLPGELEHRRAQAYGISGIPLPGEAVEVMARLAAESGIPAPPPQAGPD